MAEADDLARRLTASLDDDPAWERHGEQQTDPWGAFQWMRYTDPDGQVHYFRIVVERFRQPDHLR